MSASSEQLGHDNSNQYLSGLVLGALGVVYGDIGTSPLYALRECFSKHHGLALNSDNVLGILSLIVWSLLIVITVKYLMFVMKADNRGEGGILALLALIKHSSDNKQKDRKVLVALGLFGAALLYGDGMLTPAVSVLSAVEGLELAAPFMKPYIVPTTIVILCGLFLVQSRGTAGIGKVFGPIILLWFIILFSLGIKGILLKPDILIALNPWYAINFFIINQWHGFIILGSVFLCVTGGEALYADMGHFGAKPIRIAWFALVLPALIVNYFGQGALILSSTEAIDHPFFQLAPSWSLYGVPLPLYGIILISTAATVIASQAVITGAFSLTRQAVQLGYCPRVAIIHTSEREIGQIYVPVVNWAIMFAVIGLVLVFKESSNLASAYGIAVTTTMVVTTILSYYVCTEIWKWNPLYAKLLIASFLLMDLAFFGANLLKVFQGGWFPLLIAAMIYILMSTWQDGRKLLSKKLEEAGLPLELFLPSAIKHYAARVSGTAVFMTSSEEGTPHALLHNLKHNKVLHENVVFLTVKTKEIPSVKDNERVHYESIGNGFHRIIVNYGFMENPDIPKILETIGHPELDFNLMETTFYLSRETLFATKSPGMAIWRETLFIWMSRNAMSATNFFSLPPNRVVELGAHIPL